MRCWRRSAGRCLISEVTSDSCCRDPCSADLQVGRDPIASVARRSRVRTLRRDAAEGPGRDTSPVGACLAMTMFRSSDRTANGRASSKMCAGGAGLTAITKTLNAEGLRASRYLLCGFARCAVCGGRFASQTREHGTHRARVYGCTSSWARGSQICGNRLVGRTDAIDAEVLATLKTDILRPSVIERAISLALDELGPERDRAHQAAMAAELADLDAECRQLTARITAGGSFICWSAVSTVYGALRNAAES